MKIEQLQAQITMPSQCLAAWRYFDRFNLEQYHKVMNERSNRLIQLQNECRKKASRSSRD